MKLLPLVLAAAALAALPAQAQTTLNVVTAGDQNMVDYVNNFLGPRFEKMNPGVSVKAVGTGPGDAGSQKIYEKLSAQSKPSTLVPSAFLPVSRVTSLSAAIWLR